MNAEEKIEALTHSVERIAEMQKDNERRIGQLAGLMGQLETLVTGIAEGTARLLRVAEVHEQRLDDLEGRPGVH